MNTNTQKTSMWRLMAFASPVTPVTISFIPLVLLIPGFYAQDLGFDVAVVGAALVFARLIDAFSDPIVGALSDRTKTRIGRRRPWLLVGTPMLLFAVWNLFAPPGDGSITRLYLSIVLFYISWTFIFIPHQAWGIEMETDYRQRTRLNVCLGLFNTLGVFLCLCIPFILLSPYGGPVKEFLFGWAMDGKVAMPERLDNIVNYSGEGRVPFSEIMFLLAIIISFLLPFAIGSALLAGKEPERPQIKDLNWKEAFTLFHRNKPFGRMVLGNFFMQISVQLWTAAQPFYLAFVLDLPDAFLLLLIINQGFALITVPVWGVIAQKIGRGRALSVAGILMAIGFLLLFLMPVASIPFAIAPYLFLGAASDGKWMLPIGLAGDTSDYDTWKNKRQEPALHLAVLFLTNKIGIAMGGLTLVAFGWFGFQPGAENSEFALTAVKYISTMVPFVCSLIGVAIMWNFPISPRRHAAIERRLNRRAALLKSES